MPENAPEPVAPPLMPGDPVPWFRIASDVNPDFQFSSLAGRRVVVAFVGSFRAAATKRLADDLIAGAGARFADGRSALVLVSADPTDSGAKVPAGLQGVRFFFDPSRAVSTLFGCVPNGAQPGAYRPVTLILDERLRVLANLPFLDPARHAAQVYAVFDALAPQALPKRAEVQAPILIIPNVFEDAFCRRLIAGYEAHGGTDSGYMRERDGKTVLVLDHSHKRRSDWIIEDEALTAELRARILRRVVPEIRKAYQFQVTRMERYLVACYDGAEGGHFNAHRDNTTKGTAHRRFAVSINLNAEDYDGGDLIFAEYGTQRHRPPTGGACVFSCSLLHEATQVTRGRRYAFLPFLYDDAGAAIRERNKGFVEM